MGEFKKGSDTTVKICDGLFVICAGERLQKTIAVKLGLEEQEQHTSCLQIARAFGASDIIAVDVQDEKLEKAKTFGATATINSKIEDPIERIKVRSLSFSFLLNEMQKFPTYDESATTKAFCLYLVLRVGHNLSSQFWFAFLSFEIVAFKYLWRTLSSDSMLPLEITGGRGVDIAVEALGKPLTFSQCTQSVRDGGKAVMIGLAQAGAIGEIDINRLVRRKVQVIGSYGGRARQDLPKLVKLAESGIFNLADAVTRKYGFEEAGKAFQDLNQGKIVSRAVVEIM
ncbi:hypothetical protein DKX38_028852 [Salix brachista]|uniref:Alcohol dehydrogenase-like C-terminal domain-containing protein n=1 Tax=Salix brachista TaxID=2182728 RepID=A0A5N5J290_9ROSI|nr:hypothetical protein DKX38_028852 [Salix brachista]